MRRTRSFTWIAWCQRTSSGTASTTFEAADSWGIPYEHEEGLEEVALRPRGRPRDAKERGRATVRRAGSLASFLMYVVLRRDKEFDESHGPTRLALLFVGGEAHGMFDALYCQAPRRPPPYLVTIQDHGSRQFGADGPLEQHARRCDVLPKWLLVGARPGQERFEPWGGYQDSGASPEPGGMHRTLRRLYRREDLQTRWRSAGIGEPC